jgi:hypothetical protein
LKSEDEEGEERVGLRTGKGARRREAERGLRK